MERRITDEALQLLKQWEGLRLEAYQDVSGVWTIGYGSTAGVKEGQVISTAEAVRRLRLDLNRFERTVEELVKVPLTDNQFAALVSFCYNVGRAAFESSTLLRRLNRGDYASVPPELAKWNKATVGGRLQRVAGLANRRAAEIGLWVKGDFVTSRDMGAVAPPFEAGQTAWVASLGAAVGAVVPLVQAIGGATWPVAAVLVAGLLVVGGGWLAWQKWYG